MKDLTLLLRELANELGTTTEYLWSVLIRQAKVNAMINIGYDLLFLVMLFFLITYWKWLLKRMNDDSFDYVNEDVHQGVCVGFTIITAVLGIICILDVSDTIISINNPEYWAFKEIMNIR